MSLRARWLLVPALLTVSPAGATLLTGPFVQVEGAQPVGVANGELQIDGNSYPIPSVLLPVSAFQYRLTPSHRFLYSVRTGGTSACSNEASQVLFHRIPATAGDPLIEIRDDVCVPIGIAFELFYDRPFTSPLAVAILAGISNTAAPQPIVWVNLESGAAATSQHSRSVELTTFRVAPSGNAAFFKHGTASPAGDVDWSLVDLCPGTLGSPLAFWEVVTAQAQARVVETSPGSYVARVTDPEFPGGAMQIALDDCLSPPPPPPPGSRMLRVELEGNGSGSVQSTPAGILCGNDCDELYPDGTEVTLVATAQGDSEFEDWDGDCSGSSPTVEVTLSQARRCEARFTRPSANLGLALDGPPSPILAGSLLEVDVEITNPGPHPALNPVAAITLPPGLELDANGSDEDCSNPVDRVVRCFLPDLAVGANRTLRIAARVDSTLRAPIVLSAAVTSSTFDPISTDNGDSLSFSISALVDLAIELVDRPDPARAGGTLVYGIELTNQGLSSALEIEVESDLPLDFAPVGFPEGEPIVCRVPDLDPGERTRLTIFGGILQNVAPGTILEHEAVVSGLDTDADASDDVTACETTVLPSTPTPAAPYVRIADFTTVPPGTTGTFLDFGTPVMSDQLVAFSGTSNGAFETGTYGWRDGVLFLFADSTLDVPGLPGECEYRDNTFAPQLSVDGGEIVFQSFLEPAASCGGLSGLFHTTGCGIETLFHPRNHPAGATGGFSDPSFSDGRVTYWSSRGIEVASTSAPGQSSVVASIQTGIPGGVDNFEALGQSAKLDGPRLVFWGGADLVDGYYTQTGLYLEEAGVLSALVDHSTSFPGQTEPLHGIGSMFALRDGHLVFGAGSHPTQNWHGLFVLDLASDALERVVDQTTPMPGSAETFYSFGFPATDGGRVLFSGSGLTTGEGLFLWRDGQLTTVIAPGTLLDGRLPGALRAGPEAIAGDRAVVVATFFDGTPPRLEEAIYLVRLPRPALFADDFESGDLTGWSSIAP